MYEHDGCHGHDHDDDGDDDDDDENLVMTPLGMLITRSMTS